MLTINHFIPEILLSSLLLSLLILEISLKKHKKKIIHTTLSLGLCLVAYSTFPFNNTITTFSDFFYTNHWPLFGKHLLVLGCMAIYFFLQKNKELKTEQYLFILGIILGSFFFISSHHWLFLYTGLFLATLCYHFLLFDTRYLPSRLMYMFAQTIGSLLFLWGISYFFYHTGQWHFSNFIIKNSENFWMSAACLCILTGFFLKMGLMPLHFWLPPLYQTLPIPLLTLIHFTQKISYAVFLIHFLQAILPTTLQLPLLIWGLLTFTYANIKAYSQKNILSKIIYYTLGQNGFLLICCVWPIASLYQAVFLYWAITNSLLVFVFFLMQDTQKFNTKNTLRKKNIQKSTFIYHVSTIVSIAGLLGLPPTLTFWSKWSIFLLLWQHYIATQNVWVLVTLLGMMINLLVMISYGIQMLVYFFQKQRASQQALHPFMQCCLGLYVIVVIAGFFYPQWWDFLMDCLLSKK